MKFASAQDFWCGALLLAIAVFFLTTGSDLTFGTSLRMGPGYAPRILAGLVAVLGLAISFRGLLGRGAHIEPQTLRPLALVLGSVVFFALALERLGLVLTIFGVVLIASMAIRGTRFVEIVAIAALMSVLCSGLFVYGLKLVIPLWPLL